MAMMTNEEMIRALSADMADLRKTINEKPENAFDTSLPPEERIAELEKELTSLSAELGSVAILIGTILQEMMKMQGIEE